MRFPNLVRRRRPKPKSVVLKREWRANPGFPGHQDVSQNDRRRLILYLEMAASFSLVIYLTVFSPLFEINNIQIEASQSLLAKGADASVNQFLDQSTLGLIPHANYLLLKPSALINSVEQSMKDITSFERIVVAKHFPNGLTVNLTERAARYVWLSDRGSFGLDDQGQIVSHFNDASIRPEGLSTINDENNLPIEIGARVIKEETVKSISDFIKGLFEQNISFESISVPAISCPRTTVTNQNENDSIDGGVVINANASVNTNVNSELPQPLETDCDIN